MVVAFKVTNRYLFGSPWIPELLFVVGKLDSNVLAAHHRERQEQHRSNQALYDISEDEKRWNRRRFEQREDAAREVTHLVKDVQPWRFKNMGVEAIGFVAQLLGI